MGALPVHRHIGFAVFASLLTLCCSSLWDGATLWLLLSLALALALDVASTALTSAVVSLLLSPRLLLSLYCSYLGCCLASGVYLGCCLSVGLLLSPCGTLCYSPGTFLCLGYCCHSMLNAGLLLPRMLLSLWLLSYLSASSRPGCRLGCLPRQGLLRWAGWLCKKGRSSLEHSKAPRSCTSVIKTAGSVDSARSVITVCGFRALESTIL